MRFALINSGLGLLAAASELHTLHPAADLVIAMDPDGMPWGPRAPEDIAARSLALARTAAEYRPDVIVLACNTGSVHALAALRAEFEPDIPVVGTVPAIKPAAARSGSVAIWATLGTTASEYQRRLIADFGGHASVTPVACPDLASAIDAGDEEGTNAAIADAARHTPADCTAIVLGCTEYELAEDEIGAAVPGVTLFGSAAAVAAQASRRAAGAAAAAQASRRAAAAAAAAQASRRAAAEAAAAQVSRRAAAANGSGPDGARPDDVGPDRAGPDDVGPDGAAARCAVYVLLSGRPTAALPDAALRYRQGRDLAPLVVSTFV